ncbi:hypothetical protein EVAR_7277_1 [Eumeta japonica]|uniref:Uncharacterized protein n=1 Tax=Eumeta variegata TaxID=151549 RepID=A0A4C1T535_EUMVA|nr:hypothetical protein EVAR_7277_1 [Eumeta japonica]
MISSARTPSLKSVPSFVEEFHRARKSAPLHHFLVHGQSSDDKQRPYAKSQVCAVLRRRVPPCVETSTAERVWAVWPAVAVAFTCAHPICTGNDTNFSNHFKKNGEEHDKHKTTRQNQTYKYKKQDKVEDVTYTVKKLKWNWVGDMIRSKKKKWTKEVTVWCPRDGKRRKISWDDDMKKVAGITWQRRAENKKTWNTLGEAYVKGQVDNVTDAEE